MYQHEIGFKSAEAAKQFIGSENAEVHPKEDGLFHAYTWTEEPLDGQEQQSLLASCQEVASSSFNKELD